MPPQREQDRSEQLHKSVGQNRRDRVRTRESICCNHQRKSDIADGGRKRHGSPVLVPQPACQPSKSNTETKKYQHPS